MGTSGTARLYVIRMHIHTCKVQELRDPQRTQRCNQEKTAGECMALRFTRAHTGHRGTALQDCDSENIAYLSQQTSVDVIVQNGKLPLKLMDDLCLVFVLNTEFVCFAFYAQVCARTLSGGGCSEMKMKNRVLHLKAHSSEHFFGSDPDKTQDSII